MRFESWFGFLGWEPSGGVEVFRKLLKEGWFGIMESLWPSHTCPIQLTLENSEIAVSYCLFSPFVLSKLYPWGL